MELTLEQRVKDIEDVIVDIPRIVSLRLETIKASLQECAGRIDLLDNQMALVLREMRDLRGGVTRQLVEQDKRIEQIGGQIEKIGGRVEKMEGRLDGMDAKLGSMNEMLATILERLPRA